MFRAADNTHTDPIDSIVDPFAGVFRTQRFLIVLTTASIVGLLVNSYLTRQVALAASVHAFEIYPDGRAYFIEDRRSRLLPTRYEAEHVAKELVGHLYGWSGNSISQDLADGLSLCSPGLATQLRREFKDEALVPLVQGRPGGVRSEVAFDRVVVLEHSRARRISRVFVEAMVTRFDIEDYAGGRPYETRKVEVQVSMRAVRRSRDYPNGLEVVDLREGAPPDIESR